MERGKEAVVVSVIWTAFAFIILAVRLICRFGILRRTGGDDYLAIVAFLLSLTLTVLIAIQREHGLGRHFATLAPGEFEDMLKPFWASVAVYLLGLTVIKCSVILQLLRFMVDPKVRKLCLVLLALVCTHGLAVSIASICSCIPVAYFWDKTIEGGHCMNLMVFWYCNSSFNIITDLIVIAIPISVLRSLQIPKRQKYCLVGVFALGGFVCIMSILRLHSLYVIANSTDVTWDNVGAATWSAVELNTAIVCACLPTLKPLINIIAPRLLGSTNGTNRGSRYRPHSHLPAGYQEFSSASLSDRRKNASTYRAEVVANAGQDLPRIKIARASVTRNHDREKIINVEHSTTISFSDEPYDRRSSGSVHSTTDTAHWRTVQ